MSSRTRQQQIDEERGENATRRDLARALGVDSRTIRRWEKAGRIPAPALTSPSGWHLWTPAQQREIVNRRINRGAG